MADTISGQPIDMPDSDAMRIVVNNALDPSRKAALGQFMTPSAIAEFMSSMFDEPTALATLLDPGAGIGSLSTAAVPRLGRVSSVDAWEIDPLMGAHLREQLRALGVEYAVHAEDFIEGAVKDVALGTGRRYTHAILNPPYKKLSSDSRHRALIRKVGIETVNLYTAFVALSILLLKPKGEMVAIIPRSFCNGPYYRPFRQFVLKHCSIDRIHVFESRTKAFQDDDVLQENVIVKFVRGKEQAGVVVSTSQDQRFADYSARSVSFEEIVKPQDPELFIHVPTAEGPNEQSGDLFQCSLDELGLAVCTGPVVDFRLEAYWLAEPLPGSFPLVYPHHFSSGALDFPKRHKKPNALGDGAEVRRWLMPNDWYVLVKRFSSKEERRRIVAYVFDPNKIDSAWIGFENHWNVFHVDRRGLDPSVARGLACFLNSTVVDRHFRVFSGHTQVNATDLRNMHYPPLSTLRTLATRYREDLTQTDIDEIVRAA